VFDVEYWFVVEMDVGYCFVVDGCVLGDDVLLCEEEGGEE